MPGTAFLTVQELEAHIKKISADIETLEHSKILAQRQLNSLRDPVARLPLEISSEIFIRCLPPLPEPGCRAQDAPMLLLNVCSAWAEIARSTPALWATIRIVSPCTEGFGQFVETWLRRALNRPLSVFLSTSFNLGIAPVIWRYSEQVKHLEVCYEVEDDEDRDDDNDNDILRRASAGPLPLLETLTIRCSFEPEYGAYSSSRILQILRLAPNLVECVFDSVRLGTDTEIALVLPNLRRLIFGNDTDHPNSEDGILLSLTLPRLEILSLSMSIVCDDDLPSFMKRSSPPLRELVLGPGCNHDDLTRLDECLRLVPTLTRLELWWPWGRPSEQLLVVLAESPSCLLPKLRSWTIRLQHPGTMYDSWWDALLRALTARRAQIQTIHVKLDSVLSKPAMHILAPFKELVADGMDVYIGFAEQNFCSV